LIDRMLNRRLTPPGSPARAYGAKIVFLSQ
jgi:hypothetical protein